MNETLYFCLTNYSVLTMMNCLQKTTTFKRQKIMKNQKVTQESISRSLTQRMLVEKQRAADLVAAYAKIELLEQEIKSLQKNAGGQRVALGYSVPQHPLLKC
jgi:N-methylhydantoinase B/oxoprolinase/acetone carboxylase alpha subunit